MRKLLIYSLSLSLVLSQDIFQANSRKIDTAICPDGGILDSTGKACCPSSCGECGGYGCDKRPGGEATCCKSQIKQSCDTGKLPCFVVSVINGSCPLYGIADSAGKVCCSILCGECNEKGCDKRSDGDMICCPSQVTSPCVSGMLPCLMDESSDISEYCVDGIEANVLIDYCDVKVCCPSSCSTCDTSSNCSLADECCAVKTGLKLESPNTATSDVHISCRYNEPPCVVPYPSDGCTPNPCLNGAHCGVLYGSSGSGNCSLLRKCNCSAAGNYSGEFCDVLCDKGETPCGYMMPYLPGYNFWVDSEPGLCCGANEECMKYATRGGYRTYCINHKELKSCQKSKTNPCLNGGKCWEFINPDDLATYDSYPHQCSCPPGFEGAYCEVEL